MSGSRTFWALSTGNGSGESLGHGKHLSRGMEGAAGTSVRMRIAKLATGRASLGNKGREGGLVTIRKKGG